MDKGYLEIFVYGGRELFPAEFAEIYIKKDGILTEHIVTNEVGQSPRLEYDTPPKAESTSPGFNIPYTSLDITISKEGFYTTTIQNVQIFPDVISRLNTELVPIPDDPNLPQGNVNYISNSQAL